MLINSPDEARFAQKALSGIITVAFNNEYTAFSPNMNTVFVYPNVSAWNYIIEIFINPEILKLVSKPIMAVATFLKGIVFKKVEHLSAYMSNKGKSRFIAEMKREITNQYEIKNIQDRAAAVALIMSKWRELADKAKKEKTSYFNKRRDCHLLYLTAFNDILSLYGPMEFNNLVALVYKYSFLCRTNMGPGFALNGLIKVGALSNNPFTSVVSIPDQMPII